MIGGAALTVKDGIVKWGKKNSQCWGKK